MGSVTYPTLLRDGFKNCLQMNWRKAVEWGIWKIFTLVIEALLTVNVLTSCRAVSTADTCQKSESHVFRLF